MSATAITIFVVVLLGSIAVHELGHLIAAKRFGMYADHYFVGFGPKLWSTQRGETEYGLKAIPAGGYVRIHGMTRASLDDLEDPNRGFSAKPAWQQITTLLAGPLTHVAIAAVLTFLALGVFGIPGADGSDGVATTIGDVEAGSAAAGILEADDTLLAVGDLDDAVLPDTAAEAINAAAGDELALTVDRQGEQRNLTVDVPDDGAIGVLLRAEAEPARLGPLAAAGAVVSGPNSIPEQFRNLLAGFAIALSPDNLASWVSQADPSVERQPESLVSVVGMGQLIGAIGGAAGIGAVLLTLSTINLVLGFLNALPIPPLDGGHVLRVAVEKLVNSARQARGRPATWEVPTFLYNGVTIAMLVVLLGVAALAIYIDIVNPASGAL